jgi:hypothetical protein
MTPPSSNPNLPTNYFTGSVLQDARAPHRRMLQDGQWGFTLLNYARQAQF